MVDLYVTGTLPHGVLQQLRQDVVQRQRNEGKAGRHMAVDANTWRIPILMLTEPSAGNTGIETFTLAANFGQIIFLSQPLRLIEDWGPIMPYFQSLDFASTFTFVKTLPLFPVCQ